MNSIETAPPPKIKEANKAVQVADGILANEIKKNRIEEQRIFDNFYKESPQVYLEQLEGTYQNVSFDEKENPRIIQTPKSVLVHKIINENFIALKNQSNETIRKIIFNKYLEAMDKNQILYNQLPIDKKGLK